MFYEKVVLKNLAKFTRKHLYQSVFLKKRLWHKCFSCQFRKIFKNTFFKNISGRLLLLIKRKGKNVPIQLTFIGNLHSLKHRWFEEGLSTCVSVMNITPIWCRLVNDWWRKHFFWNWIKICKILGIWKNIGMCFLFEKDFCSDYCLFGVGVTSALMKLFLKHVNRILTKFFSRTFELEDISSYKNIWKKENCDPFKGELHFRSSNCSKALGSSWASHQSCSIKKPAPRNFAIITEKYLCWSLFLIKLQAFRQNF